MPISGPTTEADLLAAGILALVLRSFDAGARTRRLNLPYWDTPTASCHVLNGTAGGRPRRVLVGKVRNPGEDALLYVRRFAARRNSLAGGAALLCIHGEVPGEAALAAARQGVQLVTCEEGDIRIHTGSAVLARHVSVEDWAVTFSTFAGREKDLRIASGSGGEEATLKGRPFVNWLRGASRKLLRDVSGDCVLRAEHRLVRPAAAAWGARSLDCGSFTAWFACRVRQRVHIEYLAPTGARYDARKQRIVPAGSGRPHAAEYGLGAAGGMPPADPASAGLKSDFHVFYPVRGVDGGVPDIDARVEALSVAREDGGLTLRDPAPGMDVLG